jgi:DSF synthase
MGTVEILSNVVSPIKVKYDQVATRFDHEHGISWIEMKPSGVPCCTEELLSELNRYNKSIENSGGKMQVGNELHTIHYSVVTSLIPGAFNLGGHLGLFSQLIKNKDGESLLTYSMKCLDVIFSRVNHYNLPLTTISLVQGDALGGGLEAALSSDVIIAERSAKMGFPEVLFNLIPGHGAFSMVSRKIGVAHAEKMILSGKIYSAEELFEMGLVDVLVEDGLGEVAVYDYVDKQSRRSNAFKALKKARQRFNLMTYKEMLDITNIWVEAALRLSDKDLRVMDRFARSQQKSFGTSEDVQCVKETSAVSVV